VKDWPNLRRRERMATFIGTLPRTLKAPKGASKRDFGETGAPATVPPASDYSATRTPPLTLYAVPRDRASPPRLP
jgi:hypothetical protein